MKVVIAGMAGVGNLGDDLMCLALVRHINEALGPAEVVAVAGRSRAGGSALRDEPANFVDSAADEPLRAKLASEMGVRRVIDKADLVVIGGGGLVQDTHHNSTPYRRLRFAAWARRSAMVAGLGLGLGPLTKGVNRSYVRKMLEVLDVLQVRDHYSVRLAAKLGRSAQLAPDIVEGSPLHWFLPQLRGDPATLGLSLRPWGNLTPHDVCRLLSDILREVSEVRLFVFEYLPASKVNERQFALEMQAELAVRGKSSHVFVYGLDEYSSFSSAFTGCGMAVAMRYHANVLWQRLGVPVLPISYAPKVLEYYRPYGFLPLQVEAVRDVGPVGEGDFLLLKGHEAYEVPQLSGSGDRFPGRSGAGAATALYGIADGVRGALARARRKVDNN